MLYLPCAFSWHFDLWIFEFDEFPEKILEIRTVREEMQTIGAKFRDLPAARNLRRRTSSESEKRHVIPPAGVITLRRNFRLTTNRWYPADLISDVSFPRALD